jgi:hypothetical protein
MAGTMCQGRTRRWRCRRFSSVGTFPDLHEDYFFLANPYVFAYIHEHDINFELDNPPSVVSAQGARRNVRPDGALVDQDPSVSNLCPHIFSSAQSFLELVQCRV